jgi:hypothetical protein
MMKLTLFATIIASAAAFAPAPVAKTTSAVNAANPLAKELGAQAVSFMTCLWFIF